MRNTEKPEQKLKNGNPVFSDKDGVLLKRMNVYKLNDIFHLSRAL